MPKENAVTQESGIKGKRTGAIIIGFGIAFLVYGIAAASLMTPGYRQLGEEYWDTLSAVGIIMARIWSISFVLGSILVLIGTLVRVKVETSRLWFFIIGAVVTLAVLARFPFPSTSSPFFGVGGSLILLLLSLIILNWGKRRIHLEGKAKTIADLRMAGYMFFAFAAIYTCALGTINTFTFYPDQMTYLQLQEKAVGMLYRIMSLFVIGWVFTFFSKYKARQAMIE